MSSENFQLFRRIWYIGFAGHRAVTDAAGLKATIRKELENFAAGLNGEIVGLSGAAAGADLLFLEACEELGIRTVVILPFPRDRFEEDFEDPAEWKRAVALMDAATWCEVAPGNEEAPAAYHLAARQVLEVADRMLFAWDGKPPRGLGGTGETVAEAAKWQIPSRIIDDGTLEVSWQAGEPPEQGTGHTFEELPAARSVEELFRKLNERAIGRAPRSRWFAAGSMSMNHLATVLQAATIVFLVSGGEEIGAAVKFLLAVAAAGLPWLGARLRLHEGWVGDRVRAELLRSVLASHEPASPLRPAAADLFENDGPFLRSAALQLAGQRVDWQSARDRYLTERIDDQIGYFEKHGGRAERKMKHFRRLFWITSFGALIFTGAAVCVKLATMGQPDVIPKTWGKWGVEFVPAVLPGIAAWSLAMISVFEFNRRAGLYGQLVQTLRRLRPKLEEAKCASAAEATIRQIERLLLNELWEWQGTRRK